MIYEELKKFVNSLDEEQLKKPVIFMPFEKTGEAILSAEVTTEDYLYDVETPEDGCAPMADWSIDGDPDIELKVGIPAGTPLLWGSDEPLFKKEKRETSDH